MPDKCALEDHYKHWDDFISRWFNGEFEGKHHLPEPWWGWTPESGTPLRSVVINLNPGEGGDDQTKENIEAKIGNRTFREAMASKLPEHLEKTEKWHSRRRAEPIRTALGYESSGQPEPKPGSASNLSIELYPFHTKYSKGIEAYIKEHVDDVVEHTLKFAADASRLIEGPLNGTVIVRCSALRFYNMLKSLGIEGCCPDDTPKKSPYWFRIPGWDFEGVKFVCVWGARNYLPKKDLAEIIKKQTITTI